MPQDYGLTTKALLHNQKFVYERRISALEDKLFVQAAEIAMLRRIRDFAEERGLLDQWQSEPELEHPAARLAR